MEKYGKAAAEMNTVDHNGKAFNGNRGALGIAFGIIAVGVLICVFAVGSQMINAAVAAFN